MQRIKTSVRNISESFWFRVGVFAVCVLFLFLIVRNPLDFNHLGRLGYLGIFLINGLGSSTVFLPLPSLISVFISGSVWNPLWVGVISGLGNAVGELIGYFLGFGGRGIYDHMKKTEQQLILGLEKRFKKGGFFVILFFAIIPIPVFDLVGIAAGLMNYPVWKFLIATAIGRILRNILIAWSGSQILPYSY